MARIVLFGQAQFGAAVLEGLLARGHSVTAACLPPDRGGRPDPLKSVAETKGVRVIQRASYKGADAAEEVAAGSADLGVLAFVTQIIPRAILDAPRLASLCFHPSLLPRYRGGSAIPWQLIRGETKGGVTLFRPEDGVDTGPIVLARELDIGPDDSAGSYYYSRVFDAGVAATLDATDLLVEGRAAATPQDDTLATHDPLCRDEHARIDWNRSTEELHNLVRGCDPSPGAHCSWQGKPLRVYGSRRAASERVHAPGTVVAITDAGIEVATADGSLRLAKLDAGEGKGAATEVAARTGVTLGVKLEPGT